MNRPALSVSLLILLSAIAMADSFQQEILPIFERRCIGCHDQQGHKGDFSLHSAETAFDGGHIEAGDADASHLIELITPINGKADMPKDSEPLTQKEIETIRRWIDAGAPWPPGVLVKPAQVTDYDWWSYQGVVRPEIPAIEDPWIQSPIDAFVLRQLNIKGLSHSAPADRRVLIRRLCYDLLGLPPTAQQIEQYIGDQKPGAYERLVDRLLESKHYGERWARHWLDVVKYADTCGYDKDKLRPNAWPYRDYVIRSFNEDKPYARFVQEQVAGDVLFPNEPDGILGLGFIAAGPWDFIGHVEVPESKIDGKVARNLDRDDMVTNTINTFCSLTVQCARCHNHKFDPITQEHYYGLQNVFAAVDRAERVYDQDTSVLNRRRELKERVVQLQRKLKGLEASLTQSGGAALAQARKTIKELSGKTKFQKDAAYGYHSNITKQNDAIKWVEIDLPQVAEGAEIVMQPCHDEYNGIGAGFGFPVRFRVEVSASASGDQWSTVADQTQSDYPNPGLTPYRIARVEQPIRRIRVSATKLVERSNDYIFALAELRVLQDGKDVAKGATVRSLDSIQAPIRWQRSNLADGLWPRWSDPEAAERLAVARGQEREILARIETPEVNKQRADLKAQVEQANKALTALPKGKMVYAAATHFNAQGNFKPTEGKPRPVHVLHRGNVRQPRVPAAVGVLPFASDDNVWQFDTTLSEGQRRAQLARWLTDPEHPLLWRSIVNRVWQYHFGQGIVATPNDFGRMGAEPTHPELLDWLAAEFRETGGSIKSLHRLILNSSVYKQDSRGNAQNQSIDGSNQYLWRMNRRRLTAEEIRDSILSVSGALDPKMGGPGFYLFKLEKTAHSPHYEYHKFDPRDKATHRRSVYRFIVRSQPDPWMTTLDCADSSQSTPRRNETLTSLQALSLLNNKFNLVMAEQFAKRLEAEADDLPGRVTLAMQLVAQRTPSDAERKELLQYAEKHGLANLCRFLFNLSEFVYLD